MQVQILTSLSIVLIQTQIQFHVMLDFIVHQCYLLPLLIVKHALQDFTV